jgi:hypothetical protein
MTIPAVQAGQTAPAWDQFTADPEACLLNIEGHMIATRLTTKQ